MKHGDAPPTTERTQTRLRSSRPARMQLSSEGVDRRPEVALCRSRRVAGARMRVRLALARIRAGVVAPPRLESGPCGDGLQLRLGGTVLRGHLVSSSK